MAFINIPNQTPQSFDDIEFQESIGVSSLGTLLYDDVTFPAGAYRTTQGTVVNYEQFKMESVTFVVSQSKNIVRTEISGRNGTVKEYNNDGDYHITLLANLNEPDTLFPADTLLLFQELKKAPESVPIVSKILNSIFDIDNVVIEEFEMNPNTGKSNVILSMKLTSDLPFNIKDFEV